MTRGHLHGFQYMSVGIPRDTIALVVREGNVQRWRPLTSEDLRALACDVDTRNGRAVLEITGELYGIEIEERVDGGHNEKLPAEWVAMRRSAQAQIDARVEEMRARAIAAREAIAAGRDARVKAALDGPWAAWVDSTRSVPLEGDPELPDGWTWDVSPAEDRGRRRHREIAWWIANGGTVPWEVATS
jgi:hypothetical protein